VIAILGGGEIATAGIEPMAGGKIVTAKDCDVTRYEPVAATMFDLQPEVVIYTAGISRPVDVRSSLPDDWREEIAVNLLGAYHVARAALVEDVGTLIFIASLAGLYGKPNHSGYSASKAGLISLVQSLAMEGHDAYAISPGRVNTSMRERDYPGEDSRTRLDPIAIGDIVVDILAGRYTPGDNIIIRMRGHEVLPIEIHRGSGWREKLKVGEPPTC
jgi:NAD(P)-dependent dehydrogenase (short-subunit alcohol dehydrogenase family)